MPRHATFNRPSSCNAVKRHGNRNRYFWSCAVCGIECLFNHSTNSEFYSSTLGGTVGISVGDAIFSAELVKRLAKVPGFTGSSSIASFTGLTQIQPVSLRKQVLHAYTRSLATMYIVFVPLSFVGLLCGRFKYPLLPETYVNFV